MSISHKMENSQTVKTRLQSKGFGAMIIVSCYFQSERPETLPRLGELGVQGDPKGDVPDREDSGPGCGFSMGEHSPHSPVQIGDHGSRLQPAHAGQLHKQVGAKVPGPRSTHTWERRLTVCVCVILFYMLVF